MVDPSILTGGCCQVDGGLLIEPRFAKAFTRADFVDRLNPQVKKTPGMAEGGCSVTVIAQ